MSLKGSALGFEHYEGRASTLTPSNIRALVRTLNAIRKHPMGGTAGLSRFVQWQLATRLLRSARVQVPWVGGTALVMERGMQGATGNYYCGLLEYTDMSFLLDVLRPEDIFVDVGANVGVYTILASGVCGARSIALEPGVQAFEGLERHVAVNRIDEIVERHRLGASNRSGRVAFLAGSDTVNRIADGVESGTGPTTSIDVDLLDNILSGRIPTVIKIDVEGWELPVLQGAVETLAAEGLLALIVEINDANLQDGSNGGNVCQLLADFGFQPFTYSPRVRGLLRAPDLSANNAIFVRDVEIVRERLLTAPTRNSPYESA